jgi:uncharacterized protein (DUF1499 family)
MLLWLVVLAVVAVGGFFLIGPDRVWTMLAGNPDMGRQTLETLARTGKPNDALIGPASALAIAPDSEPPVYAMPASQLYNQLVGAIGALGTVTWVDQDAQALYARGITFSPTMRFPDTTEIWVIALTPTTSTLVLHARAQLGQSDMGKNRERLIMWLALLDSAPQVPR